VTRIFRQLRDATYQHVANVRVPEGYTLEGMEELNWAWQQTNTIDHYWGDNPSVDEMQTIGGHRSSMVGDVFELEDGQCYIVKAVGFTFMGWDIESVLEDLTDIAQARRSRAEGGAIPWEDVKEELGL
jgi:hypothetical protein